MLFSVAKMAFFYENNLPISSNLSYAPSCLLKFSFGECQRWSKSHLYCRGERESWDFVWNPIWKGRSWRRISVWKSNFDAAPVGSESGWKGFQMDSSCTFAKYQKTWKPSSFQQQHKISGPGTRWVVFCSFQRRTCLDSLCWLIINTFYVHVSAEVECRRKCSQVPQPTFWDNNTSRGTRLVKMLNHNSCTNMTLKRLKGW